MTPGEPAWKPQVNRTLPYEGAFSQRPAVKATLRALNIVGGTFAAFAAFVVVGLYAGLQNCEGEETHGLCVDHAGLVPILEWPIFVLSVLAPFAGGIASFVTRRPRWLGLGVAVAFVMFGLMGVVSEGQTAFDWN
jgi:hypothetical protein